MTLVGLGTGEGAGGLEGGGDLVVEFGAVGDNHEGPVAGDASQDFLGVEDHGETLATALGLPEHAGTAVSKGASLEGGGNGVIDA